MSDEYKAICEKGLDELYSLRAENERLREALRDIAWHGAGDFPHYRIKAAAALGLEGDPLVSGERRPPHP